MMMKNTNIDLAKDEIEKLKELETKLVKELELNQTFHHDIKENEVTFISHGLLAFLMSTSMAQNLAGSYIFGFSLFSLIPILSNPGAIASSIAYTLLDTAISYIELLNYLNNCLNIKNTHELSLLINLYLSELKYIESIKNKLALFSRKLNVTDYQTYHQEIKLIETKLREQIKVLIEPKKSNTSEELMKYFILVFGVLSSIASSYFMIDLILATLAPTLMGTPVGILIIILTIVSSIVMYIITTSFSLSRFMNPEIGQIKELKSALEAFEENDATYIKAYQAFEQETSSLWHKTLSLFSNFMTNKTLSANMQAYSFN